MYKAQQSLKVTQVVQSAPSLAPRPSRASDEEVNSIIAATLQQGATAHLVVCFPEANFMVWQTQPWLISDTCTTGTFGILRPRFR